MAQLPEIGSRTKAAEMIAAGRVTKVAAKNNKSPKPSLIVQGGDQFELLLAEDQTSDSLGLASFEEHASSTTAATTTSSGLVLEPWDFPLDVVYEDDELIVLNKPAGLVVHPACGHQSHTLVNALLHHTQQLSQGYAEGRPGLVHRIDKDTSGLLVIAKNDTAQRKLALQFQRKTTHRIYRAVIFSRPPRPEGCIRSFLRRDPRDRKRIASVPDREQPQSESDPRIGKLAITRYRVLSSIPVGMSLVELQLETGRTHQIRVHLSEMGHPIVGDKTYGSDRHLTRIRSVRLRDQISQMNRFALHAAELGFYHPKTNEFMKFSVGWPDDLRPLIGEFDKSS